VAAPRPVPAHGHPDDHPVTRPGPRLVGDAAAGEDASLRATWASDLRAGTVVFLVALPLCLGIALASGAPLLSGIITGVVGGLVVSRLSGSQLMVSGPAAGLTAIVAGAIVELGSFPAFLAAVVLSGALQLLLFALRAGIIAYFFPSSVIKGMLAAIGLILILKQLPYALGAQIGGATLQNSTAGPAGANAEGGGTLDAIAAAAAHVRPGALIISLVALAILVLWDRPALRRAKKLVPAPLLAVGVGLGANALFALLAPALALPQGALVTLPTGGDVAAMLTAPDWSAVMRPAVWAVAVTLALVASLETLLSLEATDKLDPQKRISSANRELMAQGVGNVTAGLLGGLPMTGVIVRSAANVDAGARTWRSSLFHGVLLAVATIALASQLNRVPLAALAAILLYTGYKLASPAVLRGAVRMGAPYAIPFVATVVAILATDLLVGIGVGLAVGTFFVLRESYANAYFYQKEESADHRHVKLLLAEEVSFLNKARINEALHEVPPDSTLTVDGRRCRYIDPDVVELLHDFEERARGKNVVLKLVDIPARSKIGLGH
jgi:MFS superfamily sulfate permease-like transporter